MSKPLTVFLSHKVRARGDAAKEFARILGLHTDKDKLDVFVSPEIAAGKKWDPLVHNKLREADLLILLYTDPSAEMDFCLYETGFFAAARGSDAQLVVVVPQGTEAPAPLKAWQNVELTREGIKNLLRVILIHPKLPVKPELFDEKNVNDLDELVDKLLNAIGPPEIRKPLLPRVWIKIPQDEIEMLKQGEDPKKARVRGQIGALQQFGIGPTDGIDYAELADKLDYSDSLKYFTSLLNHEMREILRGRSGPFCVPPLRVTKDGMARTLVFTHLEELSSGDRQFEFVLAQPRAPFAPEQDDDLTIVFHLLTVALHFRWRVIQQHKALDDLSIGASTEEIKQAMYNLKLAMDAVILDSMNRGIQRPAHLLRPFKDDKQAYSILEEIVRPEVGRWEKASQQFYGSMERADIQEAIEALKSMQDINKTVTFLASQRLVKLIAELPGEVLAMKAKESGENLNTEGKPHLVRVQE